MSPGYVWVSPGSVQGWNVLAISPVVLGMELGLAACEDSVLHRVLSLWLPAMLIYLVLIHFLTSGFIR